MPASESKRLDLTIGPDDGASQQNKPATCHLMPCSIEHNQLDVKAEEYFWPTVRELKIGGDDESGRSMKHDKSVGLDNTNDPILLASFRGRPLQGRRLTVPDGYVGHVISKQPQTPGSAGRDQKVPKVKKHFREFTYWNWDELPAKSDTVVEALNWFRVAKALHDPVE